MSRPLSLRPTFLTLLPSLLLSLPTILAQSGECRWAQDFNTYNSTRSYPMPALSLSDPSTTGPRVQSIVASNDSEWYLINRYSQDTSISEGGMTYYWLNTGDGEGNSSGEGILGCMERANTISLGEFEFSKKVLERSVNDNGDCKTMLGDECVEALVEKYRQVASTSMMRGRCPSGSQWNFTVPEACSDIVGDDLGWNSGGSLTEFNLSIISYDNASLANASCDADVQPLNASMHGTIGIGGPYNETILFPVPTFWTFFPNRSGLNEYETNWIEDVHVEVRCMKPDELAEGSAAPASVGDVLGSESMKYDKNVTNGAVRLGGAGGTMWGSVLGAAAMVSMMLW
ncbi:hypothetical protein BDV96DRAFT_647179 [Lophiotrema nucula]|uniref:Uncharacterized protein n=1 Tax=Lophiotrema nucula TaxID=690887 RepID=A0A6A5Z548_9PLEO|nr:hypothetical protein BDV96DRAFT_647179 [Lophiotrema nucula]